MKKIFIACFCAILGMHGAYSDEKGFSAQTENFYAAYEQYMKGLVNLDTARAICTKMFQTAEARGVNVVVQLKSGGNAVATRDVCSWDSIDSVMGLAGEAMLAIREQCKSNVDMAADKKWRKGAVFNDDRMGEMFKQMASVEEIAIDDDTAAYNMYKGRVSELRKMFTKKLKSDMALNYSSTTSGSNRDSSSSVSKTCSAGQTLEQCSPELCDFYADTFAADEYAAYFRYQLCGTLLTYTTNSYTQSSRENLLDDSADVSESYKQMVNTLSDSKSDVKAKPAPAINQSAVPESESKNNSSQHRKTESTDECLTEVHSAAYHKWSALGDSMPDWAQNMLNEHATEEKMTVSNDADALKKYKARVPVLRKKFTKKLQQDVSLGCGRLSYVCKAGQTLEQCSPALCDCYADAFAYEEYNGYFEQKLCGTVTEKSSTRADVLQE